MYRILVIEDDEKICKGLINHLQKWGYTAKGIENFGSVRTEFAHFDPHLVLLDITLPF